MILALKITAASNPQIIRGKMIGWRVKRFGHASRAWDDTRINDEIRGSLSRRRVAVTMEYLPSFR
jgi:hypothetical protein